MSKKIYACLLRLYPPAFRRRYEEETLQLLRDRFHDEAGFFRRLRLGFDLITDMIGALPQAYRNSYAEVATLSSGTHPLESVPSFQSLQNEPIHRVTFVVAGTLTLTALIAFGYVMELPSLSSAVRSIGNKSPIESVIERLNKQSVPESAEGVRSETPQSLPRAVITPENRAIPSGNHLPSPEGRFVPKKPGQTPEPGKEVPNASTFYHASSRSASTPSSPVAADRQNVQSQAEAIPIGVPSVISSRTQTLIPIPASLSGRWTELFPMAGVDADCPRWFIFDQRSSMLNGIGVSASSHQYPIIHGAVAGDSVRFELSDGHKSFQYDLKVEREEIRGTLVIRSANNIRRAKVRFQRAQ
jgi:hypothetical protein